MANTWPSTIPASIEVTYGDSGLLVGAEVWDDSGSSPERVTGLAGMINDVIPALNFSGVSYRFKHQGSMNIPYLYRIAAYTDDTYTTVDTNQSQGSDSLVFIEESGGGGSSGVGIVGFVENENPLLGIVNPNEPVVGIVDCGC
jgi:hypothetical protein